MSGLKGTVSGTSYIPNTQVQQTKRNQENHKDTAVLNIKKTLPQTRNRTKTEPVSGASVPACQALKQVTVVGSSIQHNTDQNVSFKEWEQTRASYGKWRAEPRLPVKKASRLPPPGIWLHRAAPQEGGSSLTPEPSPRCLLVL